MKKRYRNDDEIYQQAMENWDEAISSAQEERDKCKDDIRFSQIAGSQWDDIATESRRNRPRYEVNKVALTINQIVGDQRQNRIAVKVRPNGGKATTDLADTYNGLIRNIENASKFDNAKDNAFKEMAAGGFGAWYVTTEYNDSDPFSQDICIKPIYSAADSVFFDPASSDVNNRDARYCFVTQDMSKAAFKAKYPDAAAASIDYVSGGAIGCHSGWRSGETVKVADYWCKKPVVKEIALMSDGRIIELNKETEKVLDELAAKGVTVLKSRKIDTHEVVFYKLSGAEVLEGPKPWAGKHIPVVPAYGYSVWLDGKRHYRGMVRLARDAQRIYNYVTSAKVEVAALSPKDPYWITADQARGYEKQLAAFNVTNQPFMIFNSDPKNPGPPKRTGAPAVQSALVEQARQADFDIQSTTGRFSASLGDNPRDQSGRAILAQQRQGDIGTFELTDNLAKAVEYTGEILIDLIPKIYDTRRQIRILREDGETEAVMLNDEVLDEQTGELVILNDLSVGTYDVIADVGPSFATKRAEALEFLTSLASSSQLFAQVSSDLLAKNVDFPFSEELTKRVRKIMIQQGIVEPNDMELEDIQEKMQQAQQQPEKLDPAQEAQLNRLLLENRKLEAEIMAKVVENEKTIAEIKKLESEAFENEAQTAEIMLGLDSRAIL